MKAPDTHAALLTCQFPLKAMSDFNDAVLKGRIRGTTTVLYQGTGHVGENAKLKPYWHRILSEAQLAAVWTYGRADLPTNGEKAAVQLSEILFNDDQVRQFLAERQPPSSPKGRKRDQEKWLPLWISALQLAKVGQLNVGHFRTQKALIERLDIMMGATMGDQTIKPFVSIIYKEIAERTVDELEKIVEATQ